MTTSTLPHLIRVEKGVVNPEELAALSAVLLARLTDAGAAPDGVSARRRDLAGWRRPERASGFDGPRTWRAGARGPA
ncbi:acyl-CoA carboxylase epsilon subunit [Streptomyces sp. NPDC002825]|uniref:acyl-CoA carboxylase epsilon subunit n=1 Tax=Streptomyces sp. NPDC002825 TaxID=3154666 RepID=UPI00331F663B